MLIPPDEDGKIRFATNVLRLMLGQTDEKITHIQSFASPGEALQHMEPQLGKPSEPPNG